MRKNFTSTFLFAAAFFASSYAWADGSHTVSLRAEQTSWGQSSQSFAMSDIAEELGTDATTLYNTIQEWKAAGYASDLFCLGMSDGTWSYEHGSAGDGAFYIGQDGTYYSGWSDAAGYCRLDYDENNITITIGQVGTVKEGDIKCNVSLNYGGQTVTFDATLTIFIPEIDKTPVTSLAGLDVVGRTTYAATLQPHSDWATDAMPVKAEGICQLLGIDPEYMESHFKPMLYAKQYSSDNDSWSDELAHDFTATPSPGFWFNSGVYTEGVEDMSKELTHGAWLGSTTNVAYLVSIGFDAATETINASLGQYPGAWNLGDSHNFDLYLVYGDKAYVITYDITVDVNKDNTIEKYNNVGSEDIVLARDPRKGWTEPEEVTLDTAKILSAFGKDVKFDDLTLYGADQYGTLSNTYTADAPGFWLSTTGAVKGFESGVASFFVDLVSDTIRTDEEHPEVFTVEKKLKIGNMPDVFKGGEECKGTLYLINGENYYAFNIALSINKPEYTIQTCEIVDEQDINVKLVPSASAWEIGKTDVTYLNDIIGTTDGVFYGVTSAGDITDAYSVGEATSVGGGGFWMSAADENGMAYAAGYSGEGAYAIWYYNNVITWFNNPGKTQVGDKHHGTFYLANLWDGKAVKLNVSIKYVDKIISIAVDGEEDLTIGSRSNDGDNYSSTTVDLSKCAETLGGSVEDIMLEGEWFTVDADGNESANNFTDDFGFAFNSDGYAAAEGDDQAFFAGFFDDELRAYAVDDVEAKFNASVYVRYNEKTYAFNLNIIPASQMVGISDAKANAGTHASAYDISGRKAAADTKGIIIKGSKKFIEK